MANNFLDLWKLHFEWCQGILVKEIRSLKTADVYLGHTPDAWYNFALPKVSKPNNLDLEDIKAVLTPLCPPTTIYLWENHIKTGFPDFLRKNDYKFFGSDTWMVFNSKASKGTEIRIPTKQIDLSRFSDYEKVTNKTYDELGYDDRPYNKICHQTLAGKRKSKIPDFSSEFFMVYEHGKPAAGAGLFLTKEAGYFHNDATLREYRNKGYHIALIKKRVEFCLERRTRTLYSIVEFEKQSFRNYKKCGFEPWQIANLFTRKS